MNQETKTQLSQAISVETYMLPPGFRQRSHLIQRFYLLVIVLLYSFTIGFVVYSLIGQGDDYIGERFNFLESDRPFFLMGWLSVITLIFQSFIFHFWSRSRLFKTSFWEFLGYLICPVVLITGLEILTKQTGRSYQDYLEKVAIIQIIMGSLPAAYVLVLNLIRFRTYPQAKWRTILTMFGLVLTSLSNYVLFWFFRPTESINLDSGLSIVVPWIGGVLILALGVLMTLKKSSINIRQVWSSFQYLGGLPSMIVFSALLAISLKFAFTKEWHVILFVLVGLNGLNLFLFTIYLLVSTRIKNIPKTNPIINEFMLKSFVVVSGLVGLLTIELLPIFYPNFKEYATSSYAILFLTSTTILLGVAFSHFTNMITFTKFFKLTIALILIAILLVLGLVLTIIFIENSATIMQIISKQLIVIFLLIAIIPEMISIIIDIIYLIGYYLLKEVPTIIKKTSQKSKVNYKEGQ